MQTLSPLLSLMEQAVRKAGESLVANFAQRENLTVEAKKPGDFVSEADRKSEEIIVGILRKAYPEWGILGEEGTDHEAGAEGIRWIIDPLDGTTNFLHGLPHWCVTIGLEKDGEIIAGVTYDPNRNELFHAEKGQGAFLNGKRINVSDCKTLDMAVIGMASWGAKEELEKFGAFFTQAYITCPNVLTTASTALDLAYVAAGRLDACYSKGGAHPWDMAAGSLLITEAGGMISNHDLQPASIYKNEVVAGNPVLYKEFIELIGLNK